MSNAKLIENVIGGLINSGISASSIQEMLDKLNRASDPQKVEYLKSLLNGSDYDLGDVRDLAEELGVPSKEAKALKKGKLIDLILANKTPDEVVDTLNEVFPDDPISFDDMESEDGDEDDGGDDEYEDDDEDSDGEYDDEDDDYEDDDDDDYDDDDDEDEK